MHCAPEDFGDRELELVHLSRKLKEAQSVEALFDAAGEDYVVNAESYRTRSFLLFNAERIGAHFFVPTERAETCRELLRQHAFSVIESGEPPG